LLNKETIELDDASDVNVKDLKNKINAGAPRFTFYVLEHQHQGESKEAIGREEI
jgi:twinfilin-like protein